MSQVFAIEIQLTRPVTPADEAAASAQLGDRFALRQGQDRVIAVLAATEEAEACAEAWARAEAVLPADTASSALPDAQGQVWLTFALPEASAAQLRERAAATRVGVEDILVQLLREAVKDADEERLHAIGRDASALLARHGLEAVVRALSALVSGRRPARAEADDDESTR